MNQTGAILYLQTSGGLLVSVAPEHAPALQAGFTAANVSFWNIGQVVPARDGIRIAIV